MTVSSRISGHTKRYKAPWELGETDNRYQNRLQVEFSDTTMLTKFKEIRDSFKISVAYGQHSIYERESYQTSKKMKNTITEIKDPLGTFAASHKDRIWRD